MYTSFVCLIELLYAIIKTKVYVFFTEDNSLNNLYDNDINVVVTIL